VGEEEHAERRGGPCHHPQEKRAGTMAKNYRKKTGKETYMDFANRRLLETRSKMG